MEDFPVGHPVVIRSPGHRKDGHTGYVVSTPKDSFWGFYSVEFLDDSDSGNFSFLPSEVTKTA